MPALSETSRPAGAFTSFAAFLAHGKQDPVYVVLGVQGSGTNLLRSILGTAFNFSFVQDQSIVYNAALELGADPSAAMVRRQFEFIRSRLFASALTRKMRRRIKSNASYEGIEAHFDPSQIACGADLARFIYAYGAFTRGTTLMAIKSDDLWQRIDRIDSVLPNRRIVLLTRDFRDNLLSITKKEFGPVDPVVAARYVKTRFNRYEAEYRRTPPAHRLHVRYEELLEDPDGFVARFAQHFGTQPPDRTPPSVDRTRIRSNNMRKWKSLGPRDLACCEGILEHELQTYGYGLASAQPVAPGRAAWLLARARDTVKRVPQKLRNLVNRVRK